MQISRLDDSSANEWDAFVLQEPTASFFHRAGWSRVIASAYGYDTHFLMARRDDQIVGVLPLVHLKTMIFGQSLISTGFCVYGGIASSDPAAIQALADEAARLG